MVQRKINSQL